jgi:hypothetical protein
MALAGSGVCAGDTSAGRRDHNIDRDIELRDAGLCRI